MRTGQLTKPIYQPITCRSHSTNRCFSNSTQACASLLHRIVPQGLRRIAAPGFLDSLSPWSLQSTTPKPMEKQAMEKVPPPTDQTSFPQTSGSDHRVSHRKRLSIRDYPDDCPSLNVRWFYAIDVRTAFLQDQSN